MNKMAAEVLVPIKPPFMPPPAFELVHIERPKFERPQRQSSDFSNIPAILKGPQLSRMRSSFLRPQDKHAFGGLPRKPVPPTSAGSPGVRRHPITTPRVRFAASPARQKSIDTVSDCASSIGDADDRPRMGDLSPSTGDRETTSTTPSSVNPSPSPLLPNILKSAHLGHVMPLFQREEIDTNCFLTLTNTDMVQLGISKSDTRRMVTLIAGIKKDGSRSVSSPRVGSADVAPPSTRLTPSRPRSRSVGDDHNQLASMYPTSVDVQDRVTPLDIGYPPPPPTSLPGVQRDLRILDETR
jgi:hypothetical protein